MWRSVLAILMAVALAVPAGALEKTMPTPSRVTEIAGGAAESAGGIAGNADTVTENAGSAAELAQGADRKQAGAEKEQMGAGKAQPVADELAAPGWLKAAVGKAERELTAKYGARQRERIERGLRQMADYWNKNDGDAAAFEAFVMRHFAGEQQT
ncbi:MAG: hypothetical protein ACRD5F_04730, partial [Candidatus Acidiferrales bacterium]